MLGPLSTEAGGPLGTEAGGLLGTEAGEPWGTEADEALDDQDNSLKSGAGGEEGKRK